MEKSINRLGAIGGIIVIAWGIFLVIVTELNAPKVWNGPGIFGPYAGRVGGIILIIAGIVGIFGSLVNLWSPFLGGCILLLVCILLVLALAVTLTSPFIFLNIVLVGIFVLACQSSIGKWTKN